MEPAFRATVEIPADSPRGPGYVTVVAAPDVLCRHGVGRSGRDWDGVRTGLEWYGVVHTPDLPRATPAKILVGGHDLHVDHPAEWLRCVERWHHGR